MSMVPPPRIALSDCSVELRLPTHPEHGALSEQQDLDGLCTVTLGGDTSQRTHAYVGETILAVLHVRAPTALTAAASPDALPRLLERLDDARLHLVSSNARPLPRTVPLRPATEPPASQRGPGVPVLGASHWTLAGPAEYARAFAVLLDTAAGGRLEATIRERSSAPADAPGAIARAGQKRAALTIGRTFTAASAPLEVHEAIRFNCDTRTAAGRTLVVVAAENCTSDALTYVDEPDVRVAATQLVRVRDDGSVLPVTAKRNDFHVDTGNALLNTFDFVPRFVLPENKHGARMGSSDDDDGIDVADDDIALLLHPYGRKRKRAVRLAPGECFHFVYEVSPKGVFNPPAAGPEAEGADGVDDGETVADEKKDQSEQRAQVLPHLEAGLALESTVVLSWRVSTPLPGVAMASGVRNMAARWRPHTLASGVVVALAGPRAVAPRAMCDVRVTVRNQRSTPLERAVLCVRRGTRGRCLTPLRTAVALGRVAPGQTARVALRCVALATGALALGDVLVVERAADGGEATVWAAQAPFEVLVADPLVDGASVQLQTSRSAIASN